MPTPDADATLELRREIGGWRDYLDGRPVHCGDQLILLTPTGWTWGESACRSIWLSSGPRRPRTGA